MGKEVTIVGAGLVGSLCSLYMSKRLNCVSDDLSNIKEYITRIEARPCFKKAINA